MSYIMQRIFVSRKMIPIVVDIIRHIIEIVRHIILIMLLIFFGGYKGGDSRCVLQVKKRHNPTGCAA